MQNMVRKEERQDSCIGVSSATIAHAGIIKVAWICITSLQKIFPPKKVLKIKRDTVEERAQTAEGSHFRKRPQTSFTRKKQTKWLSACKSGRLLPFNLTHGNRSHGVMLLQFTLAACLHKTLLIHVDRLFDVGLCLIEQLACQTHLRAWGVCVWGGWTKHRGCVCVDAEQLKTRFLVPVLIIIATVWCVYSNEDLVFLSFFSHTRWWDAERMDGWMDGCARRSLSGRCRHSWESGEEDEPDWNEEEEALVALFQHLCAPSGRRCVDVFGGKRGGNAARMLAEGRQQCLRVSVTDMFDHVSELPASNGCRSRDLDQREPPARRHRKWMMHTQVHTEGGGEKLAQRSWVCDEMEEITLLDVFKMQQRCSKAGR